MAGKYANGFDWLPSGASTATISALLAYEGWYILGGSLQGASLTTGRFGYGQCIAIFENLSSSVYSWAVKTIGYHNSDGGFISCGLRVEADSAPSDWPVLGVFDAVTNIPICSVTFQPNGVVAVWRGHSQWGGAQIGISDAGQFNDDTWFDVEVFLKVHSSTGEVQVKINTASAIHLQNVNTQGGAPNAYFDSIYFGWRRGGNFTVLDFKIDDFRYYDTTGSLNNTWLGTCRVQTLLTTGAGSHTDFSHIGASTDWQAVQNKNVDDTIYAFDATAGHYDLFTWQALVNSPVVDWVQMTSFVRQDDATQRTFKNRISSSGVTADGAAYLTSQTFTADTDAFELDPNTGLQFTGAGVNALQAGPYLYA